MDVLRVVSPTLAVSVLGFLLLSGCTSTNEMYQWGSYPRQLYDHLSASSDAQEQIAAMEETLQVNKQSKPMPPGFHAHLGLLYGNLGQVDDMREQFLLEKQLYPEAGGFIDFLLQTERSSSGLSNAAEDEGEES